MKKIVMLALITSLVLSGCNMLTKLTDTKTSDTVDKAETENTENTVNIDISPETENNNALDETELQNDVTFQDNELSNGTSSLNDANNKEITMTIEDEQPEDIQNDTTDAAEDISEENTGFILIQSRDYVSDITGINYSEWKQKTAKCDKLSEIYNDKANDIAISLTSVNDDSVDIETSSYVYCTDTDQQGNKFTLNKGKVYDFVSGTTTGFEIKLSYDDTHDASKTDNDAPKQAGDNEPKQFKVNINEAGKYKVHVLMTGSADVKKDITGIITSPSGESKKLQKEENGDLSIIFTTNNSEKDIITLYNMPDDMKYKIISEKEKETDSADEPTEQSDTTSKETDIQDKQSEKEKDDTCQEAESDPDALISDKPVIYLYGYNEKVNVKVDFDDMSQFTVTYPKYRSDGWDITAKPDGHLYTDDGKEYRYLYYEASTDNKLDFDKGFSVRNYNIPGFLEIELTKLGLNADERNEFIIYWLPQMQKYKYCDISFLTGDEYDVISKLNVSEKPNNMIRVYMLWKGRNEHSDIPVQEIKDISSVPRTGKTVVEWGGTKVD